MKEYYLYKSPLGILEITCEEDCLKALLFRDEEVTEKAPAAHPGVFMQQCIRQLDEYFDGSRQVFSLPLRQSGTAFQQKVWMQLCEIPYARHISYLELAKRLGDAKCIRAAGTANGKNNIAIIVPCHRVIGTNKKLVGYAGGLWRKQWLLEHEAHFGRGELKLF